MNEKVKGVNWHKASNKWVSSIKIDGKDKHLGLFKTYQEAVKARKQAEIKYGFVAVNTAPKLKNKNDLTQEMLKELFTYDPETGHFTWLVKPCKNIKVGAIAGSINTKGYTVIKIGNKRYQAHRLSFLYMTGKFPEAGFEVDHINHTPDDNRWINLRLVTHQGNNKNKSINSNNTSGCMGVYLYTSRAKWAAEIWVNGKKKHLGYFVNYEDAVSARKAAELKYNFHENHGKLNQNQIKEVI